MKILSAAFVIIICSISHADLTSVPSAISKFLGRWQGEGHYVSPNGESHNCDALMDIEVTDKFPWEPDLKGWWLVMKLNSNCGNYGTSEHYYKVENNGLLSSSVYKGRLSHYQDNIILLTWGAEYNSWPETELLQSYNDGELLLNINRDSKVTLNKFENSF